MPLQSLAKTSSGLRSMPSSSSTSADATAYGDRRDTWDSLQVAGVRFPGIAEVHAYREHRIDVRRQPGSNGALFTDLGAELARVSVRLRLWTDAQLAEFQRIKSFLQPKNLSTGKLEAVDVLHPALDVLGIRSIYFHKVGAPRHAHERGVLEIELEAIEFSPPKAANVTNTPKASRDFSALDKSAPNFLTADNRAVHVEAARPSKTMTGP